MQLVTLDRAANASLLEDFTCSYNVHGITVELTVVVRRAALVRTVTTSLVSDAALPAALLRVRVTVLANSETASTLYVSIETTLHYPLCFPEAPGQ